MLAGQNLCSVSKSYTIRQPQTRLQECQPGPLHSAWQKWHARTARVGPTVGLRCLTGFHPGGLAALLCGKRLQYEVKDALNAIGRGPSVGGLVERMCFFGLKDAPKNWNSQVSPPE